MKRWSKILGLFGLLLLPGLLWACLVGAQSFRTGDNTAVGKDEVVDSTLYAAGRTVDVAGEVRGDVICAGQNITISGKVNGDVICAGQTVTVSGNVTGDVRAAGQTVTVSGDIEGSLSVASQSFSLSSEGGVGRDAGITGNGVNLNGNIGRDLAVGATSLTIADEINRNVTATVQELTLARQARVGGNVTYTSTTDAKIADGAQVSGNTTRNEPVKEEKGNYGQIFAIGLGTALLVIVSLLVSALIVVLFFPAVFHQSAKRAQASPLKTFLTGLLASFAVPVVIVALMMTVIGLPLGLLLMLAWMIILAISGAFFSYFLGRLVLKGQTNPIPIMLVGALIVTVAYFIPVLGMIMFLAAIWFGSGIILRELYHRTPKPTYDFSKK